MVTSAELPSAANQVLPAPSSPAGRKELTPVNNGFKSMPSTRLQKRILRERKHKTVPWVLGIIDSAAEMSTSGDAVSRYSPTSCDRKS